MKRLAILSSLALLASPCFSSAICNGGALNQGRVFNAAAEGGDDSSSIVDGYIKSTGTITFGTSVGMANITKAATKDSFSKLYTWASDASVSAPTVNSISYCYFNGKDSNGGYAMRLSASKNAGSLVFSFGEEGAIISEVTINACVEKSGDTGCIKVAFDNETAKNEAASSFNCTDWTDFVFSDLDGGNQTATKTVTISGAKKQYAYIHTIKFTYLTKIVSEAPVVTYDYGEVNYKNITNLDLKPSEAVEVDGTITNPLPKSYLYEDWTGLYEFVGWYTDKEKTNSFSSDTKITEDITLYAKWDVVEGDAYTALKKSETKAQLNYKYGSMAEGVGNLHFCDDSVTPSDASNWSDGYYTFSGLGDIKASADTLTNCYHADGKPLKVGKSGAGGSITFTFSEKILVKKLVIHAAQWKAIESVKFALAANDESAGEGITVKGTTFSSYESTDLNGSELEKLTITSDSARLYISQIEIFGKYESSEPGMNISDIGMRFGALLEKANYDAVTAAEGSIASYGVTCATNLNGCDSLVAAIKAGKLDSSSSNTWTENVSAASGSTPIGVAQTIGSVDYYVFNTYIEVNTTSLNTMVYAVGFLTLDTGATVYFSERSASVASLAKEYIDTGAYDGDIATTLGYLAAGKVSE